jgi:hypothetical protein
MSSTLWWSKRAVSSKYPQVDSVKAGEGLRGKDGFLTALEFESVKPVTKRNLTLMNLTLMAAIELSFDFSPSFCCVTHS